MTWSSTFPSGTVSVRANRTIGQGNTTYIENTMGNVPIGTNLNTSKDHFWNVDANLDGYHRKLNFPILPSDALPANASLARVVYCVTVNNSTQLFTNGTNNIANRYQVTPGYSIGGAVVGANYANFSGALPANVYGE